MTKIFYNSFMSKIKRYRTDFLFPKSSFITGMGSIFDLTGNYYTFNTSKTASEADFTAIRSDWGMVGQDIEKSVNEVKKDLVNLED